MRAALVVLDGWGIGSGETDPGGEHRDAVAAADTPQFDALQEAGAAGRLRTDGAYVGLPEGQMGNSEVGHLTIGAGRIVRQDSTRITDAIDAWRATESTVDRESLIASIARNDAVEGAFDYAADHGGRLHVLGLVSDGGVHSMQAHVHAVVELAAMRDVEAVTHAFTDGRDTPPDSGRGFLGELERIVALAGTGDVATVCGRYFAMDRDHNWERTRKAYDAIVEREAEYTAPSAVSAVEKAYDRGETDEYVEPTLVGGRPGITGGDAAVFVNFRADRARQLTRMLADIEPEWPFETDPPDAHLVTMTAYDADFDLPVAFPPRQPEDTLGEVLARAGLTQARLAESEKYAHVTYFLNGGREVEFEGETRRIVPSPDVPTYDRKPEMHAAELTDEALDAVVYDDPALLVLNYANPDMVGHSGDFEAAVAACEAVDAQLGRLIDALGDAGGHTLVTADHGNADDMGSPENPHTAHTTNPVPFVYLAPDGADGGRSVRGGDPTGGLADLAPTLLELADLDVPEAMTGESLLE
jgi:2,3-bisphosphoglycerate-independent phosphoglycerate mutase